MAAPGTQNGAPATTLDTASFDPHRAWMPHTQVSVRPEPFGALLYHFGNRRLSFLKERRLLDLVQVLGDHSSARAAHVAVGIPGRDWPRYDAALGTLVASEILAPVVHPSAKEPS